MVPHAGHASWAVGTVASFLLCAAGVTGLGNPRATLLEICGAGILYAVVFWLRASKVPHKREIALGVGALFLLSSIIGIVCLPPPPHDSIPRKIVETHTGTATTSGDNSPAVTGSGNSISINSDSGASSPKKREHPKTSTQP